MLSFLKSRLRHLPRPCRRRHSKLTIVIKPRLPFPPSPDLSSPRRSREENRNLPIRIATFNAAFFLMAPAVASPDKPRSLRIEGPMSKDRPKSILKNSPLHRSSVNHEGGGTAAEQQGFTKSKPRVSINLPDNAISLMRKRQLGCDVPDGQTAASTGYKSKGKSPMWYGASFCGTGINGVSNGYLYHKEVSSRAGRTIEEVLREVGADIVALQDVKAEEERGMRPLHEICIQCVHGVCLSIRDAFLLLKCFRVGISYRFITVCGCHHLSNSSQQVRILHGAPRTSRLRNK